MNSFILLSEEVENYKLTGSRDFFSILLVLSRCVGSAEDVIKVIKTFIDFNLSSPHWCSLSFIHLQKEPDVFECV